MPMSAPLPARIRDALPKLGSQEGNRDPIVHIVFYFPFSEWVWFATEGEVKDDDFLFFGYVIGLEREWGHFTLNELESVNANGIRVRRDEEHLPQPLSECLKRYGLDEK